MVNKEIIRIPKFKMDAKASLSIGYENNHFRWIRRPEKPIYTMVRADLMVNKKNIKFGSTHIFLHPPPRDLGPIFKVT